MKSWVKFGVSAVALTIGSGQALAENTFNHIDEITVVASAGGVDRVAGSASLISPEDLEKQVHTDILRILRVVPGLNIQEEDGFGLRPNIGIRGTGSDRSARILIMEDGVPMAPAPYSSPSAYYFPTSARMNAVEVVKGPATVRYGPYTTGGAINMFSTPIPEENEAKLSAYYGGFSEVRVHGWAGNRIESTPLVDVGILVETFQQENDGFKDIDRGGDTGIDVEDYVVKLGFYTKADAKFKQSLELKYQHREETSNETYLGLTDTDFAADPFRRYNASQLDQFKSDHDTYQINHFIEFTPDISLTTVGYRTDFHRNWFKSQGINAAGGGGAGDVSLSSILEDPISFAAEYEILVGAPGFVSADDAVVLRNNNRTYYTKGIQTALAIDFDTGPVGHDFTVSARLHKDEVDRFQHEADYRIDNSTLVLTTQDAPGSQANRIQQAEAFSVYIADTLNWNDWQLSAGLRYEDISTKREDYSTADPTRAAGPTGVRENDIEELLYSVGLLYQFTEELSAFGGVHKGFTPPSPSNVDTEPETSTNIEFGVRYNQDSLRVSAIGYFNKYKNLLGDCTNSTGGNCIIGDQFDAGRVDVFGVELTGQYDFGEAFDLPVGLPVNVVYSYTNTEFKESFNSSFEPWGNVLAGFELPYVPHHQVYATAGVTGEKWGFDATVSYVGDSRSVAGDGSIPANQLIESHVVVDASIHYDLTENVRLKAKAENLFDNEYAVARRPAGLRPGKPLQGFVGIEIRF